MSKMKKTLNRVLTKFEQLKAPLNTDCGVEETLRTDHFQVCKTVRYGFPYEPTSVAFDPVQHLLAIGTKSGSLRILGRPGVDIHCNHGQEVAVIQILFLINEGALVTVCSDDSIHLWNYRQKRPEIVHTLKFQRERITYCHLPFTSKWLYVGTERGNVHIANIESFTLSGYVINWNKAIELSRKTHPGPVVSLTDCPIDPNKLLIGFETGTIVLWDLKSKTAECRFNLPEALRSVSWHHEGKQFMCSHTDGSLTTYNIKQPQKPVSVMMPHAQMGKDGKLNPCKPITKVEWKSVKNGEPLIIFSGGMSYDRAGRTPSITVMNGKSTTALEMEHNIIDFVVLCETPWQNDFQEPYAIVVLLQYDLVVVDLTSQNYPCFENPYPMDIHESPVTACQYYANCPPDLIPAFYSVGSSRQKRTGFSEKSWPVNGGEWGTSTCSYPEIFITGHADGSLKFWDASSVTLQVLYKLKTAKMFEKPKKREESRSENRDSVGDNPKNGSESMDPDPFAVYLIHLCTESRILCFAGATHLALCRFSKQELNVEVQSLEFSIIYHDLFDDMESPDIENHYRPGLGVVAQFQGGSRESYSSNASDHSSKQETWTAVKVRPGSRKYSAGYYPDLVCVLQWLESKEPGEGKEHPGNITFISMNSTYGLLAFGNESGLAIVDYVQRTCLLNLGTPDLYGSMDPYNRGPRSPRNRKFPTDGSGTEDGARSPTNDQSSPPSSPNLIVKTRKKHSHEKLVPMQAIHERLSQEIDDSVNPQEKNNNVSDAVEVGVPAEELDNIVNNLEENYVEEGMRNQLQCFSKSSSGIHLERAASVPSPPTEVQEGISKALSEGAISKSVQKKLAAKTVSDPSQHNSIRNENDNSKISRPRSSSDPDADISNLKSVEQSTETNTRHNKKRRVSLTTLTFKKNKHKNKNKEKHSCDSSDGCEQTGKSDDECKSVHPRVQDILSDEHSDSDIDEHPPPKSFLRRMSVKVKNIVMGNEKEEKKFKVDIIDLSSDQGKVCYERATVDELQNAILPVFLKPENCDRNDTSSFSRSRSSSMSSLENVSREAIQSLVFSDSYTGKTDNFTCPCLWVGTSLGSVIVIVLNLPPPGQQRLDQPVIVSPSGTMFRLKGAILTMSFLDCNGVLIPSVSEQWRDNIGKEKEKQTYRQNTVSQKPKISPTSSTDCNGDKQYVVICSEKQARVISLPSQQCPYKTRITESSFVVRADVVSLRDSACLTCYVANGRIMAFSLPSLKPLLDIDFLPLNDVRIARTFCFSSNGHASYLCSATEIQKITFSADLSDNLNEMLGELFKPCDTPDAPKQGFFKNWFGSGQTTLDREELFGESSGKGPRGLATRLQGKGSMQYVQNQASSGTSAVAIAHKNFIERGEKLGELGERSEMMRDHAENFASDSRALMLKYKNKKWYQW
ncbi:syntaxin-binding protein 5-like isoform X5 [Ostrea edulis]|uniref:syntaxin-binding protein 5-like isoform X5 n=1 Tax=Ostrea edulis TaxID=37623 RepID=UPI0024AF4DB6|nr:syntaxin-binding protein 5-like isoform X5 [Ostrea edulis]